MPYRREADPFIITDQESFSMRDSPSAWAKRSESFESVAGYVIFARRLELCLRSLQEVAYSNRQGLNCLIKDLWETPSGFLEVRSSLRKDLSNIHNLTLADIGAGSGSLLGYLNWVGLPYPRFLLLLEPNPAYFNFINQRLNKSKQQNADRLMVLGQKNKCVSEEIPYTEYFVWDNKLRQESHIQVINASARTPNLPVAQRVGALTLIGVSKYYNPPEFKQILDTSIEQILIKQDGTYAFNAQLAGEALTEVPRYEQLLFRFLKIVHQYKTTGRPTLHNTYGQKDLQNLPGKIKIVRNCGNSAIVRAKIS